MSNDVINAQNALQSRYKIPKKIHYIWIGGNAKPQSVYDCIESWKKACPDYEIIEWNESNFDINANRYAREAYEAKKFAFVTDYMRLVILKNEGGIYVDTDLEILKNFDGFLEHDCFFGFENQVSLLTACFGAKKGCKFIDYLLSYYDDRSFKLKGGKYDTTTNVITVTALMRMKCGQELDNRLQVLELDGEKVAHYPYDYLCAKDYVTGKVGITENTYAVHHFNGSWLSRKNKFEDKLVVAVYKIFGEKNFRKIMRVFLKNRIKGACKKIKKTTKQK